MRWSWIALVVVGVLLMMEGANSSSSSESMKEEQWSHNLYYRNSNFLAANTSTTPPNTTTSSTTTTTSPPTTTTSTTTTPPTTTTSSTTTTTPPPTTTTSTTTTPPNTTTSTTTSTTSTTSTTMPPTTLPPPHVVFKDCQKFLPINGFCHWNTTTTISINNTNPCVFTCWYDPSQLSPPQLTVDLSYKKSSLHPTFVSIQQKYDMNSWNLPIIFPQHNTNQPFTTIQELLCPPLSIQNETVTVRITTESVHPVLMGVKMTNISYDLRMGMNVSLLISPVSPWFKLYRWQEDQQSVMITADSPGSNVCAFLALQNAKCPVRTTQAGMSLGTGRYQTFTAQGAMIAYKSMYPDGVHIVIISLPDDQPCSFFSSSAGNHTNRKKTVVLSVISHSTIGTSWYIFAITAFIVGGIIFVATKGAFIAISWELGDQNGDDGDLENLLPGSTQQPKLRVTQRSSAGFLAQSNESSLPQFGSHQVGSGEAGTSTLNSPLVEDLGPDGSDSESSSRGIGHRLLDHQPLSLNGPATLAITNQESSGLAGAMELRPISYLPASTLAPNAEALKFTNNFNPRWVYWWQKMEVFEATTSDARVSEVGFQCNLLIMAVFAALPCTELLRSYLTMVSGNGYEDQCYYNSRCMTVFGPFPDFGNVFTNIGYIMTGVAYTAIVNRHQKHTYHLMDSKNYIQEGVGISRHYGLFKSLGYGLVIQGIMSSVYHTCPNSVTLRFDMMFMYVVAVMAVVGVWGLRHGDVKHHVYPTVGVVGVALLCAEGREWISHWPFWSALGGMHLLLTATTALLMSRYGTWSFSPNVVYRLWRGWKPVIAKLALILLDNRPALHLLLVIRVIVGVSLNFSLVLYSILSDPEVYWYILLVCLVNMGGYVLNYLLTKRFIYKERGTKLAWAALLLSLIFWIFALTSFIFTTTDSEATPSASRAMNYQCTFFGVFDPHDAWHLTSAFALFFFFIFLLTLDDDIASRPSNAIPVF